MSSADTDLPFVDEHRTVIAAPRDVAWSVLRGYVDTSLGIREGHPFATLVGARPRTGFELSQAVPERELRMTGRHRFSTYALVFHFTDAADGRTILTARTYALFPGLHGRIYRALVIGTRAHVVATIRILRSMRRAVEGSIPG